MTSLSRIEHYLLCALLTVTANSAELPRETQVITFPTNRSLGKLYVRDVGTEGPAGWTELGEARGRVEVPPGKEVKLSVGDRTHESLADLARLGPDDLQEIEVYWADLKDSDLQHLAGLTGLRYLSVLGPVTGKGLEYLRGMSSLKRLWFARTEVCDQDLVHLRALPSLETIYSWANREITGAGFGCLADAGVLENLDLFETPVNDDGLAQLAQIRSLRELSLQSTEVTDAGLAHLVGLPYLRHLVLPPRAGDESLADLKGVATLESLNLMHTRITDDGVKHLIGLKRLKSLVISSSLMTGEGLVHLRQVASLEAVVLNLDMITPAGLARMAGLPVTSLNLGHSAIGDEDLVHLEKLHSLTNLSLRHTHITDAGLSHLKGLRSLKELNLRDTAVTDSGVEAIKEALAGCQVTGPRRPRQEPDRSDPSSAASLIGRRAPELGLERILQAPPGTEVSWEKLKGNVVALEFWATWCGPCLRALPHVNAMVERFRDRPVRFISVTSEPETVVADCLKRYRLRGWVGLDTDRSMFESYGVDEIPYTVVVDSDGIVVRVTRPTDLTAETLERLLTKNGR